MQNLTRRNLITGAIAASAALAQNPETQPPLSPDLVKEFVSKAHGELDPVRELVKKQPRLVYASHDWGAGDWETGLNAASHMGHRDTAEFLLDSGSRPDAPAVFMLGLTATGKAMLAAFPNLHKIPGAHGIPLLTHAIAGKKQSFEVFQMLIAAGADVNATAWRGFATPLTQAVVSDEIEMVRALLEHGADRSIKNPAGLTPLDIARKRNLTAITAVLEKG
jgi:hypothetical protein